MGAISAVTSSGRDSPAASGVNDDGWGADNLSTLRPLHSSAVSGHRYHMQPHEPIPFEKKSAPRSMSIMEAIFSGR